MVVGRVREVGSKRWKVDINARQDGVLMLSSVNLSGGVQRRRTYEDSLQMRFVFAEGDLISVRRKTAAGRVVACVYTACVSEGEGVPRGTAKAGPPSPCASVCVCCACCWLHTGRRTCTRFTPTGPFPCTPAV